MGTGRWIAREALARSGRYARSEAELRHIHLPGYVSAIRAGVGSIMVSYNSWNGVKCPGASDC